jgi:MFS family permease
VPLPVLLAALGVAGLGAGCFLAADSLPLLLIGRLLFGLSAGVFTGTATATAAAAIGIWAMPEPEQGPVPICMSNWCGFLVTCARCSSTRRSPRSPDTR